MELLKRSHCNAHKLFRSPSIGKGLAKTRQQNNRSAGVTYAFKNFGDGLLDYMEAGPKLRKWYGEGERKQGGKGQPSPEDEDESPRDAILVTDADSPLGELVLLQLILARLKVVALVRNPAVTLNAYGSYVTPIPGNIGDSNSLAQALRKSRAVICTSRLGALPELLSSTKEIEHVVLLSSVGAEGAGFFSRLIGNDEAVLGDEKREAALQSCEAPLTVVRVGKLVDAPGGTSEIQVAQGESTPSGNISREDAAQLLVRALQKRPKTILRVAVQTRPLGTQFKDWDKVFAGLDEAI